MITKLDNFEIGCFALGSKQLSSALLLLLLLLFLLSGSMIDPFSFSEKAGADNNNLFHETFLELSHKDERELGRKEKWIKVQI